MARTRLGLFGGTFDPPHLGHVAAVRAAWATGHYDRILVVVAGDPYQKTRQRFVSTATDRLAMANAAFAGLEGVEVSDRELRRTGASFTIDTVRELLTDDVAIELLVGADTANALPGWHSAEALCELVTVGVFPRPHTPITLAAPWRVREIPMEPVDLSSTGIRLEIAEVSLLERQLPGPVVPLYLKIRG